MVGRSDCQIKGMRQYVQNSTKPCEHHLTPIISHRAVPKPSPALTAAPNAFVAALRQFHGPAGPGRQSNKSTARGHACAESTVGDCGRMWGSVAFLPGTDVLLENWGLLAWGARKTCRRRVGRQRAPGWMALGRNPSPAYAPEVLTVRGTMVGSNFRGWVCRSEV